jgi:hypothetical protein
VSEYFFEEEEDEESEFTPGSLIEIVGLYKPKLYTILAKWRINSHQYMYRLLCENGGVYETYCDPDYWSKVG